MKLRRIPVIAATGVMAVGTLIGVTGAGAASASTALCVSDGSAGNYCASAGSSQFGVEMSNIYASNWSYPTTPYQNTWYRTGSNTAYIQEAGTNNCLQLDHGDYNVVKLTPCVGDDADEWVNYYNPNTHRTEFISFWSEADNGYNYLCLSFDAGGDVPGANPDFIRADPCQPPTESAPNGGTKNWYQQWTS
jgi:hypothetical protein